MRGDRGGRARVSRLLIASLFALAACGEGSGSLPEISTVPAFELVDQDGERFRSSELEGEVSVVDFVFTSCPSVCPMLTSQMANLQRRLASHGDAVRFVSISVDPEVDRPERLREYAQRFGASTRNWSFLTGDRAEIARVSVQGFKLAMGERTPSGDAYDITHGTHFVLVDQRLVVRGYYRTDADGMAKLERDVALLLE